MVLMGCVIVSNNLVQKSLCIIRPFFLCRVQAIMSLSQFLHFSVWILTPQITSFFKKCFKRTAYLTLKNHVMGVIFFSYLYCYQKYYCPYVSTLLLYCLLIADFGHFVKNKVCCPFKHLSRGRFVVKVLRPRLLKRCKTTRSEPPPRSTMPWQIITRKTWRLFQFVVLRMFFWNKFLFRCKFFLFEKIVDVFFIS